MLIKSILLALPVYAMSCFRIPNKVLKEIEMLIARFWWKGVEENRGMHWISWKKLTIAKDQGGMGFKELRAVNDALIAKQMWRVLTKPNLLISKVMKEKYFAKSEIFQANSRHSSSWI